MSNPAAAPPDSAPQEPVKLARTMGLWALIIYGVGDMLGSGIYALIGKAAGLMGNAIWVAFLVSMVAALLTGLSYACLGSRYPRAAGVAYITLRAFKIPYLSFTLGLAVIASGLTSMATGSRTFAGYFQGLTHVPADTTLIIVLAYILILTFINFWGMKEATWLNVLCTSVEVTGLFIVIAVGARYWGGVDYLAVPAPTNPGPGAVGSLTTSLVLQGAVLTFFSFVGFEDMINVTEEVKDPRRNFPRGVMGALAITTLIYLAVAITAVSVMPFGTLAKSGQPLVDVVRAAAPAFPPAIFSFIALFAITNTGLLNYIMGSRVVYGMASHGLLPAALGAVHPVRCTPHIAILILMVIVVALAFVGDIKDLASATSALLLTVFIAVNAALIALKNRPGEPKGAFEVPIFVPAGGILVCATLLVFAPDKSKWIALALFAGISIVYFLVRPKSITEETFAEIDETT